MPRKKKVEAPAAEAEVKAAETAAEVVEAPAKKTTAKKTTTAKKIAAATAAAVTETKKAAASKAKAEKAPAAEKVAPKAEVIIEFNGVQVAVDEIIKNAKIVVGEDKDIKVYVQPDTSKAYIAFDGQTVEMDVYFS